jgi:hypothetical protein
MPAVISLCERSRTRCGDWRNLDRSFLDVVDLWSRQGDFSYSLFRPFISSQARNRLTTGWYGTQRHIKLVVVTGILRKVSSLRSLPLVYQHTSVTTLCWSSQRQLLLSTHSDLAMRCQDGLCIILGENKNTQPLACNIDHLPYDVNCFHVKHEAVQVRVRKRTVRHLPSISLDI